jgi:hypothetical protein
MKMKLFLLSAFALGSVALSAAEVTVEPPLVSMKKEWNDGSMTGKNTHAMYVGGKKYADCWSYWYVDSGITPQTAVMKPMNAVDPDFITKTGWANYTPVLAASFNAKKKGSIYLPGMIRNEMYVWYSHKTFGAAYGFRNPFAKDTICYIEGRLRHPEEAIVYVYVKSADGKFKMLTDSKKPGALFVMNTKHRNGQVEKRQYLKLQIEVKLAPGDTVMFAGFRPDFAGKPTSGKKVHFLSVDDRWGKAYQPKISFEQ